MKQHDLVNIENGFSQVKQESEASGFHHRILSTFHPRHVANAFFCVQHRIEVGCASILFIIKDITFESRGDVFVYCKN